MLLIAVVIYLIQGKQMQTVGSDIRIVENISKEDIYSKWSDINNWHTFNDDLDYAK